MMLNCIPWFWYKRQSSYQNLLCSSNEENVWDNINTHKPNLKQPLKLALYYMTMDKSDNDSSQEASSNSNQETRKRPENLGTGFALEVARHSSSPPITPPFYSAPSSPPPQTSSPPTEAEMSTSDQEPDQEEEEEEEEEEYIVRRTLSLKISRTPPDVSPSHLKGAKKVVRFADSLGLDLEVVRMYPDWDQPPEGVEAAAASAVASSGTQRHEPILVTTTQPPAATQPLAHEQPVAMASLSLGVDFAVVPTAGGKSRMPRHRGASTSGTFLRHAHDARATLMAFPSLSLRVGNAMSGKYLSPTFPQPGASYSFLRRVKEQKVCLERITNKPSKCRISGTVVVENIAFHKTVYVRYTVDDWITHSDHLCTYVTGSTKTTPLPPTTPSTALLGSGAPQLPDDNPFTQNTICTDLFSFDIVVPFSLTVGSNVYLAILLRAGGREYWDNNGGANYQLRCYAAPVTPVKPAKASTSQTGSSEVKQPRSPGHTKRASPTPLAVPIPSTLHDYDTSLLTRLKQSVDALGADNAKSSLSNDLSSVDEGLTRPNSLFGGSVKRTSRVGNIS